MTPRHADPSYDKPRKDSQTYEPVYARAPYNFIPLPEDVAKVENIGGHDVFAGRTGWFDCELETKSPTYIRGMMSEEAFQRQGRKKADELSPDEKEERAPFYSIGRLPAIPGSTLRGLIRSLVEIAGFGRMRWVGKEPTFTYRAVASQADDPLRQPYKSAIGNNAVYVRAGYLTYDGQKWMVQPAKSPKTAGLTTRNEAFLRVYDEDINPSDLPGFLHFDDLHYRPQIYRVSFEQGTRKPKKKKPLETRPSWKVAEYSRNLRNKGMLVTAGNMNETAKPGSASPRMKHVLMLEEDFSNACIPIPEQVIDDYRAGLSPYQKEYLSAWQDGPNGCLAEGKPVFYVVEKGQVAAFGHSPNFRIPAKLAGESRAARPTDFIPENLTDENIYDLADALFGWTPERGGKRTDSRAGRVSFETGKLEEGQDVNSIWYGTGGLTTPRVLGGPKPTTFQHYLVQDRNEEHDPDQKVQLAHYGTPTYGTQIRGHKMYWHRGQQPGIELPPPDPKKEDKGGPNESQLTRIRPIKAGVRFKFRVWFENLSDVELGALQWALQPRGEGSKLYVHKLGMGKPLGMGAVHIKKAKITLTERKEQRYKRLFAQSEPLNWEKGETVSEEDYRLSFENFIQDQTGTSFLAHERILDLLAMMEWQGDFPGEQWMDWTRYMEIEHQNKKGVEINEYKERPVLPSPRTVIQWAKGQRLAPSTGGETAPVKKPAEVKPKPKPQVHQAPAIPRAFKEGGRWMGRVYEIDDDGTVWLDFIEYPKGEERMGRILPKERKGWDLRKGERLEVEILKFGKYEIDCRPIGK